jgi:hypothetical protein
LFNLVSLPVVYQYFQNEKGAGGKQICTYIYMIFHNVSNIGIDM